MTGNVVDDFHLTDLTLWGVPEEALSLQKLQTWCVTWPQLGQYRGSGENIQEHVEDTWYHTNRCPKAGIV
jgi:hypothetical protein